MPNAPQSRTPGILLLVAGGTAFAGTALHWLPYQAFLPATISCILGLGLFMRAHRAVTQQSEHRIRQALEPELRSQALERHAARQAQVDGRAIDGLDNRRKDPLLDPERRAYPQNQPHEDMVFHEIDLSD
ncbi:MAG: hypothetical protein CBC48_08040 [bacterium TMED88]|nr:hypothetical protein [Deltaproteobacteria bacterium]OUV32624.1 MAG: hypothetical protein CBC48_08040 [bacterium TMED88]